MKTTRLHHAGIFAAAALIAVAFAVRPVAAVGTDTPPPSDTSKPKDDKKGSQKKDEKKKNAKKQSEIEHAKFLAGYRAARDLILAGKYEDGIAAMHALKQDSHPDVANYIGYANRKLGKYDDSKKWYEAALAADPKHVRTWSYYGMWHAEQGNRLKANEYLRTVKRLCGNETCKEFAELKAVIDGTASY